MDPPELQRQQCSRRIAAITTEPANSTHYDDEIDLVDIARVLLRRKWWIIGTFLVFTLGAVMYGLQQERVYSYTTSIQLGEFGPDETVESAGQTTSAIQDRILLGAKRAFLEERDLESMPFDVTVNAPDAGSFVNLVSEAPLERKSLVADFQKRIYERLRGEHQEELEILIEESDAKLENLRDDLASEKNRLSTLEGLQVDGVTESGGEGSVRAESHADDQGTEAALTSTDSALTMLLSQLQFNDKIAQSERRINSLEGEIRDEEIKRSYIKPTRAEDIAVASLSPVGTSRALIAVLGAILGGMLGLFMAFIVEFAAKVRESEET